MNGNTVLQEKSKQNISPEKTFQKSNPKIDIKSNPLAESSVNSSSHPSESKTNEELTKELLKCEAKKYIRVATDYYRLSHMLNAYKQSTPIQQLWRKGIIIGDHGKEILTFIEKYIAFVNIPDNSEFYQKEHIHKGDHYFNLYEQIKFIAKSGEIKITTKFLSRMFQDKLDIILDYLKIIYENPTQNLPVICLVSKIQETGKSTFMVWLCSIFGQNAIILGNEEFSTNFNSLYASKLIICIDESFIDKNIIKEKIKRLTTTSSINMEAKGRDSIRMDFFGKLILSSNTEDNFIKMDDDDNRFFVVKVPELTQDDFIPDLMTQLKNEIPAFLYFLKTRDLVHQNKSRLWFDPKVYETEALSKIRMNTRGIVQKELLRWFGDVFAFNEVDHINVTPIRLAKELDKSLKQVVGLSSQISHVLKDEWKLTQEKNNKFDFPSIVDEYDDSLSMMVSKISFTKTTGTYYTITLEFFKSKTEL